MKTSNRTWWMAAAGLGAGALLGRVLPPLFAQARGAVGAASGEDPFEGLIAEHKRLLALLDRMEKVPYNQPKARLALLWTFKRTIAKHAMAEEDVVYPLLHEDADRAEATEKLYKEHGEMKIHIFTLQRSAHDSEVWTKHVRELRDEIARHARQEEEEEFPRLREIKNLSESSLLHRNIRQEEALIL